MIFLTVFYHINSTTSRFPEIWCIGVLHLYVTNIFIFDDFFKVELFNEAVSQTRMMCNFWSKKFFLFLVSRMAWLIRIPTRNTILNSIGRLRLITRVPLFSSKCRYVIIMIVTWSNDGFHWIKRILNEFCRAAEFLYLDNII